MYCTPTLNGVGTGSAHGSDDVMLAVTSVSILASFDPRRILKNPQS